MSTKKAFTFVAIDADNIGSSGKDVFMADVKKTGIIQVFNVYQGDKNNKQKSDVNGAKGYRWVSLYANGKEYNRCGYDVFADAVLSVGEIKDIQQTPEMKEKLEDLMSSSTMQNSVRRARKKLEDVS